MISRVGTADDAASLLEYLLGKRDRQGRLREVSRLGGPAGMSFDGVVKLFEAHARLRPDLGLHVGHAALRLAPGDRHLSRDEWREVAGRLAGLAFGADVWTTVQHDDTHVHVMWSRVRRDGTAVCHSNDRRRAEAATRDLERLFDLKRIPSSWQLNSRRSPAPPRHEAPEAPGPSARRSAAWAAWKACRNTGTRLWVELANTGVPLCLNEESAFCVDLGDGRRVPLVRVLADCSRRAGCHPPREREVLAGLEGLDLATMDLPWLAAPLAPEIEATMPGPAGEIPDPVAGDHGLQAEPEADIQAAGELPPTVAPPAPAALMPGEQVPADVVEPVPEVRWVTNPAFTARNDEWMRRSDVHDGKAAALQSAQEHLARLVNAGPLKVFSRMLARAWTGQDALECARTAVAFAAGRRLAAWQELEQLRDVRPYEIIQERTMPAPRAPCLADPSFPGLTEPCLLSSIRGGAADLPGQAQLAPGICSVSAPAPKAAPRRDNRSPPRRPRPAME